VWTWLSYLGVTQVRHFVDPTTVSTSPSANTANWRAFASHTNQSGRFKLYGDQFGRSFGGDLVVDSAAWSTAVAQLRRGWADSGRPFFAWLEAHKPVNWGVLLRTLNTTSPTSSLLGGCRPACCEPLQCMRSRDSVGTPFLFAHLPPPCKASGPQQRLAPPSAAAHPAAPAPARRAAQNGNAEYIFTQLRRRGYATTALWDIRCNKLRYTSLDPADPEYWRERWETYRLFYIGGQWLARHGVGSVELYNEPNRDACTDAARFADDVRIRSAAVQDAYLDATRGELAPTIIAPTVSAGWEDVFSPVIMQNMHRPFPRDQDTDAWTLAEGFSFHKYGSFSAAATPSGAPCDAFSGACRPERGYGLRALYDRAVLRIAQAGQYMPAGVSVTGEADSPTFCCCFFALLWGSLQAASASRPTLCVLPFLFPRAEFNCYTASVADSLGHPFFVDRNVMDSPLSGACIAAQVAGAFSTPYPAGAAGPTTLTAFKFAQTRSPSATSPSKVIKNGL
jgi:hypothetical protein